MTRTITERHVARRLVSTASSYRSSVCRRAVVLYAGSLVLAFASCSREPPVDNMTRPSSTTGQLSFTTSANRGWSSIDVTVGDRVVGTLTSFVNPDDPSTCSPSTGRVVAAVTGGISYNWSARSNTGAAWSGTTSAELNGCRETRLTCENRDCAPSIAPPPTLQLPVLQCRTNSTGNTTVATSNRSVYTFTLSFDGPTRGSSTIPAGETRTVRVDPGQYRLTATAVNASNVIPATRTQTLTGGCDYELVITVS